MWACGWVFSQSLLATPTRCVYLVSVFSITVSSTEARDRFAVYARYRIYRRLRRWWCCKIDCQLAGEEGGVLRPCRCELIEWRVRWSSCQSVCRWCLCSASMCARRDTQCVDWQRLTDEEQILHYTEQSVFRRQIAAAAADSLAAAEAAARVVSEQGASITVVRACRRHELQLSAHQRSLRSSVLCASETFSRCGGRRLQTACPSRQLTAPICSDCGPYVCACCEVSENSLSLSVICSS